MSLPLYLKRDMRRLYGKMIDLNPCHDLAVLRDEVEAALDAGVTPTIEGWGLRRGGLPARRVAEDGIGGRRRLRVVHQKRGDLWIFQAAAS